MSPLFIVTLVAAPIVIGVIVDVIWSRRINRAREEACAAMKARWERDPLNILLQAATRKAKEDSRDA